MYQSIFNNMRKEKFLESLQESMDTNSVMKEKAKKIAEHLGISVGEAFQQLRAHLVRKLRKKKERDHSLKESFKEFIAEYESVLAKNGIEEYDLDEATEYFIEEIMPQKQEQIINEGIEALLSEEMSVDEFIEYLEEGAAVQVQGGRGAKYAKLHGELSSAVDDLKNHEVGSAGHLEAGTRVAKAAAAVVNHLRGKTGIN